MDELQHSAAGAAAPAASAVIRGGRPDDAAACGAICYEAFRAITAQHGFPPDFPSVAAAVGAAGHFLSHPLLRSFVADVDGRVVGSNFYWSTCSIGGVGPITVDPAVQNGSIGRRLMEAVLQQSRADGADGVRLVQAAYHSRSLSLYAKLGFDAREPLSMIGGEPLRASLPGLPVRPAVEGDVEACTRLYVAIHGFAREADLREAIGRGSAMVVERAGRIAGYATAIGFMDHAVGETDEDLQALIAAAPAFTGPGFLLPTRNTALLRWCLARGLRVIQPLTLMSMGSYQDPRGAFLPSIIF
ncbi:MAG: GNAT family N-acetyltransferase [Alphaproteobacteria bacterium]|nr:GNAT family N-acetyltransferase [Alphaproteobacteria bacterium]